MDFNQVKGKFFYFVGIKGSGMSALALLLDKKGGIISGVDSDDYFPTQEPLEKQGIFFSENIKEAQLPQRIDCIIYSAAYNSENTPVLKEAKEKGILLLSYPEALGLISLSMPTVAICGTHGKTTTTAITGAILKGLKAKGSLIVGAPVKDLNNSPFYSEGNNFLIVEACEYRRHFLNLSPSIMVVLNIEWEHVDFFSSYREVEEAFLDLALKLPNQGILIYSSDDKGSLSLAQRVIQVRKDIQLIPYGETGIDQKGFFLDSLKVEGSYQVFKTSQLKESFRLPLIGKELVLNTLASLAVIKSLGYLKEENIPLIKKSLETFQGVSRRQEKLGEKEGILIMDDYAHHPKEIEVILKGLRSFYPDRRIVVDFMFHTLSRTRGFLNEFKEALTLADSLILQPIYTSPRESSLGASDLLEQFIQEVRSENPSFPLYYFSSQEEILSFLKNYLKKGDIFITMGAGDNFKISHSLLE